MGSQQAGDPGVKRALAVVVCLIAMPSPAFADPEVTPGDDDFNVEVEVTEVGNGEPEGPETTPVIQTTALVADPCGVPTLQPLLDPVDVCDEPVDDPLVVTPGLVAAPSDRSPCLPPSSRSSPRTGARW